MILQVMVAFDKKARAYLTPFFVKHVDMGVRSFSSAVNTEARVEIYEHPEDFSLWHMGTYDDENAVLETFTEPSFVAEAIQLKKGLNNVQHKVA